LTNTKENNEILSRRNSWTQLNGLGLTFILVSIIFYFISSTTTLTTVFYVTAIAILTIVFTNYVNNFEVKFYESHMTVEYKFIRRLKTINYFAIEKVEFVSTAKSPTRLRIVYLDNKYGRHDLEIIRHDNELVHFVETKLKPIVMTNNFTS
jgi:hypothetical protein